MRGGASRDLPGAGGSSSRCADSSAENSRSLSSRFARRCARALSYMLTPHSRTCGCRGGGIRQFGRPSPEAGPRAAILQQFGRGTREGER
jgi:hypothetical protein